MLPCIAILAAFLPIFSVALRQAQNHGTPSSTLTIASGSDVGSSQASPHSFPQPNVLAASAVRSKACRPKNLSRDSSHHAVNQPVWTLRKRTLETAADYQGNQAEFILAEYDKSIRLRYEDPDNPWSVAGFVELGNQRISASVDGLRGCTAVIVVSRAGVWMGHFWESPSFRDTDEDGGGGQVEVDVEVPRTEADKKRFKEQVLLPMQDGGPRMAGLRQYVNPGGPFHPSQRVEYAIITPRLYLKERGKYEYEPEVREINAVLNSLFPGAHSVIIDYVRKREVQLPAATVAGKLVFQYDPWQSGPCDFGQTAMYKVWSEDGPIPILTNKWMALPQQVIDRPEDYGQLYRPANFIKCASSTMNPTPAPQQTALDML